MDFDTITDDEQKALLLIGNTIRYHECALLDGDIHVPLSRSYYGATTDFVRAFAVFGFRFENELDLATAVVVLDGILYLSDLCFCDHAEYGDLCIGKGY